MFQRLEKEGIKMSYKKHFFMKSVQKQPLKG
jgi:hypothetical protein